MSFLDRFRSESPSQPDPPDVTEMNRELDRMKREILGSGYHSGGYISGGSLSFQIPPSLPALPRAPAKPAVPHEQQAEPVRALKGARLVLEPDGVRFTALTTSSTYAPEATSVCHCRDSDNYTFTGISYSYLSAVMSGRDLPPGPHKRPERDSKCGFYAWKHGEPFPFKAGIWLLEVDLYGRVIEHEHGYRAQKQRVLRASPVPGLMCEPPYHLVAAHEGGHITAACGSCPDTPSHPVTPERLRALLNVEIDLGWAQAMRDGS